MSDLFDPYYKWLGIRPENQPPNHYQLLGIAIFENDPDVIQAAADGRMSHLRTYQMGNRSDLCQRLLNEVAAAKNALLNPQQRATYDQWLQQCMLATAPAPAPPAPPPVNERPEKPVQRRSLAVQSLRRRRKSRKIPIWPFIAVIAIGLAVALLFVTIVLLTQGGPLN